jgi:hypothetical protein
MRTHYERYFKNLEEGRENEMTLADIKGAAGAISIAGGNTTWATIVVCILHLILYPEVQQKVKAEIDKVTGGERLPTFEDREKMPYLEYVIEETTRIVPLWPLGVPHASLEDGIYEGMLIPKGSIVYANAQAMTMMNVFTRTRTSSTQPVTFPRKMEGWESPFLRVRLDLAEEFVLAAILPWRDFISSWQICLPHLI